ncbi:hypothetical protein ON010_g2575 [Phytophthora cinnamomi]|nr:hypothetical protein ON010_g2575 [Phytophthora cinnamomi]
MQPSRGNYEESTTRDIAYNTQLESVKTAFNACGIDSSVWTHANRGSGSKLAELHGADENHLVDGMEKRMEACYLTTIPRKAMRALAGVPTKGGGYWIDRATVTPSLNLQKMVFPDLDSAEDELQGTKLVISLADNVELPQRRGAVDAHGTLDSQPAERSTRAELRLSRSLLTVHEIWIEYTRGIARPISVCEAEQRFGSMWRKDHAENRFFSRRLIFYDAIKTFAAKRQTSEETAAEELEKKRKETLESLNRFGKIRRKLQLHQFSMS